MATAEPSQSKLTLEECERLLVEASEQFMRGEISVEAFEEAERRYMPDYRSALIALAKRRRISGVAARSGREVFNLKRPDQLLKRFARRQAKRLVAY